MRELPELGAACQIMSSTSPARADHLISRLVACWRARRAFSPREAWKIEMDLDSEIVRSKKRGLCRVCLVASMRSSCLRPAVACGSAASSRAYRSAALRPPSGACRAGYRRGLCVCRTAGRRVCARPLAGLEAEGLGAGAPPAAGRLSAAFAGLDVVAGRVLGRAAVDLLPDVVKVVALAQRRDDGHRLIPPRPEWQSRHAHQMVHGCGARNDHASRVTKRAIKIRNEKRINRI